LTIRNIDGDGNDVQETGQQGTPVPVAKGWLRVSHRELDPELSLPYRPYHRHQRRLYLEPGEIVRVEVEIWPTSMVFRRGHRIRPRHPAARRHRQRRLHALPRRLQHRNEYDLRRRWKRILFSAPGSSSETVGGAHAITT